jgi:hypothetical protein
MSRRKTVKKAAGITRKVAGRITQRCARNEVVVVVPRNGKASRVFGLRSYQKMMAQPAKHKPWEKRKSAEAAPDPLGAVDGNVHLPISRQNIYE